MINYNSEDLVDQHTVNIVVKDSSGNLLMQDHVKFGFWTIPIGKVKPGQSIEEAVKEEVLEECGVTVTEMKKLARQEYDYERNGKMVHVTAHLFEVVSFEGEITNAEPEKHREQVFMSVEKVKNLPYLSDATVLFLKTLGFSRLARL